MSKRKAPSDTVLRNLYLDKKLSSGEIADKYNMSRVCVARHIKRLGITRPESGLNSRNKKRKGEVLKTGYPALHLPDHPRASAIGYVFKHILEMEKHIGRTPRRDEPIHHIDLARDDYNIKNLYLCKNNSEHQQIHASLNKVVSKLIKKGFIKFKDGVYYSVKI